MANAATAGWDGYVHLFHEGKTDEEIAEVTGKGLEAVGRKRRRMVSSGELKLDPAVAARIAITETRARLDSEYQRRVHERLLQERASLEMLTDAIRDAVRSVPYVEVPRFADTSAAYTFDEEEACLLLGDLQVGETVDIEGTGGLGHYNKDVFLRRAATLELKVERILSGHQQYQPIKVLNIFGLGDFVEGMTIYPGQLSHIDLDVIEQIFHGANRVAQMIIYWLGLVDHINLFGVLGNHGRIGRKGELPTTANLDYLFLKHLELLLKEYIEAGRITAEFPKTWFQLVERQNHRFFIVHGDDIKGWMSLPWYGAQRAVQRWQELIVQRFDYFIFGHHHTEATWESNAKEVIANGSWVGTNEYSAKQLNVGGRPSQQFFGLHPTQGKTWTYRLFLDDGEPERVIPIYRGVATA